MTYLIIITYYTFTHYSILTLYSKMTFTFLLQRDPLLHHYPLPFTHYYNMTYLIIITHYTFTHYSKLTLYSKMTFTFYSKETLYSIMTL